MVLELSRTIGHYTTQLLKYTPKSKQRSITANCIAQSSLRNNKYRGRSQFGLQLQKGSLTLVRPSERNPLPGEASKRSCKPREIPHESPVVACKSYKAADIEDSLGPLPS